MFLRLSYSSLPVKMLDGSEVNGEWSATHSENAEDTVSGSEASQRDIISRNSSEHTVVNERNMTPVRGSLNQSYDHADYLMDRIDAELQAMTNVQTDALETSLKEEEIESLKAQGVEFDSEVERKYQSTPVIAGKFSKTKITANNKDNEDGTDTGLGSGSAQDEAGLSDVDKPPQPVTADFSEDSSEEQLTEDEEEIKEKSRSKPDHMELDSDTAEQIEEKFQQIMKKKRVGGYMNQPKSQPSVSKADDLDSVKTEDFMEKFKETLIVPSSKTTDDLVDQLRQIRSSISHARRSKLVESARHCQTQEPVSQAEVLPELQSDTHSDLEYSQHDQSDLEISICTEDFEKGFSAALVSYNTNQQGGTSGVAYLLNKQKEIDEDSIRTEDFEKKFKEVANGKTPPRPQLPAFLRKPKESDIDSIRTEDFENKFKQMQKDISGERPSPGSAVNNVKANLQMMFAQAKKKEAELDSIKTEEFEQKFRELSNPKQKQHIKPSVKKIRPKANIQWMDQKTSSPKPDSAKIDISSKMKTFPFSKEFLKQNDDAASLRTEDYEGVYRDTLVKRVAGIPITSFDQCHVDSDIDTVKSALVHDKFQNALETSLNDYSKLYEESDASLSEPESAVELKHSSQGKSVTETNLAEQGVMLSAADEDEDSQQGNLFDQVDDSDNEELMQTAYKFDPDEGHADDEDDEEAREIQLESARIQREIVKERVHKISSTPKQKPSSPKFTDRVVGKKHQLKELDDSVQKAKEDKQPRIMEENGTNFVVMRELKAMKERLRRYQVDIKMAEKQAKENRTKAEDARTELMLTEFKRDSAKKELEKVVEEINRKKKKAKGIDEKIKAMNKESKDLESMGITKEEVIMIVAENEELQTLARNAHTTELERNELLRQLESTKEELFAEQKKARSRSEALEEEIELAAQKLEQSKVEMENLHKQLEILDAKYKQVEQEKNQLIEAKSSELNTLQNQTEKQVQSVKKQTSREVTELKQKIVAFNEKVGTMRAEINQKDQMTIHLREQVVQFQQELTRETELKEQLIEENQRNIKTMKRDKDNAINKLKEVAMSDKQRALDELRVTLEKEMNNSLTRCDERLTATISDHQKTILTKDQEIQILRERLKNQEDSTRHLGEKLRAESRENTRQAIDKEKEMWEREKKSDLQRLLDNLKEQQEKDLYQKMAELETEKAVVTQLRKQIATLTEELEDLKCQTRMSFQERMIAVNKAKEEALTEKEMELGKLQEKFRKERVNEVESLKEQLRKQEEEITQSHSDLQRLRLKEQEMSSLLERQEKTVVQEINEECRKISAILGVTPRTTALSKSPGRNTVSKASQLAITTSALANLKACAEEFRHYVEELKQEIQSNKQTISRLHRDKENEIDKVKQRVQEEKSREMDALRERLIKDHLEEMNKLHQNASKDKNAQQLLREKDRELREIQQNMTSWKEGTAEKLAKKFEEELNRELEKRFKEQKYQKREHERLNASQQREIDRLKREVQRLSNNQTSNLNMSLNSAGEDSSTVRLLQQLQNRVKQLRSENTALRRGGGNLGGSISNSVPDLANTSFMGTPPMRDSSINRMESKLSVLERKAELAEDRAEKNQQMLTSKMAEVSKLQNTLTQQTKELMQLERAYSQLKQQTISRSPTSRFNMSR